MGEKNSADKYGIGKASEVAFDFLRSILTPPIEELNGILTDEIKFLRYKNQVKILLKTKEFLKEKEITSNKIPLKSVSNILDYASYEEDELMQDRWAKLLASAATEKNSLNLSHTFAQILNQLSGSEVLILEYMFRQSFIKSDRDRPFLDKNSISRQLNIDYEISLLVYDNLIRLRLVQEEPPIIDEIANNGYEDAFFNIYDYTKSSHKLGYGDKICLSSFGVQFVRQCNGIL